jgi:hypothetical protein
VPPVCVSEEGALNNPVDERRSPRANVLLIAAVECGGARFPVRVSNLSAHGVLVIGKALPCADTRVIFRCNGLALESWVAWTEAPHAGIQFSEPIQPEELLQSRPVLSAAVVRDTRKLDFRRPGFSGNQLTQEEREVLKQWRASQSEPSAEPVRIKPEPEL